MEIVIEELERLTKLYGGEWGINHTRRLLKTIEVIGKGQTFNEEAVLLAAYLHDWGGYAKWSVQGLDHAIRSKQVVEEFLKERSFSKVLMKLVIEAIEFHHTARKDNSIEAKLLSDADALDFLGAVGVLRDFSKNPKDMRKAYEAVKERREKLPARLFMDESNRIAEKKVKVTDEILREFEQETCGMF